MPVTAYDVVRFVSRVATVLWELRQTATKCTNCIWGPGWVPWSRFLILVRYTSLHVSHTCLSAREYLTMNSCSCHSGNTCTVWPYHIQLVL